MSAKNLAGKRVAILADDGFEQRELEEPRRALKQAGAETIVLAPGKHEIRGWDAGNFAKTLKVDAELESADSNDYDALLLPGGAMSPDKLRQIPEAVAFVRSFIIAGKPVAAICHGPQLLIETHALRSRTLTSSPSIKTDLINAGARWVDEPVVVDHGLITSRRPDDIPAFNEKMIEQIWEGPRVESPHTA